MMLQEQNFLLIDILKGNSGFPMGSQKAYISSLLGTILLIFYKHIYYLYY